VQHQEGLSKKHQDASRKEDERNYKADHDLSEHHSIE